MPPPRFSWRKILWLSSIESIGLGSLMAGRALAWRRLIEQDPLAGHGSERLVAQITIDFLVSSLQ